MINNNNFFIKNLTNVVFIGESNKFEEIITFNKSINLKSTVITSLDQSKLINKKVNYKIFNRLDKRFYNFVRKNFNPNQTLFISIGARLIFKDKDISTIFKNNLINVHGTRLPLDSGGGGFSWKIMREDRIDNQCFHLVDNNVDTGPIIFNKLSIIPKKCITPDDFLKLRSENVFKFYKEFIKRVKNGEKFSLKPQIDYVGRYNPRLDTDKDGYVDWSLKSYDLINFINAFETPHKGASTFLNNNKFGKVYIKKAQLHGGDSSNHPFMTGIVSRHDKDWLVVSTNSKHMLLIEEVLDKSGKNIIKKIKVGDRFFTPIKFLESSFKKRSKFFSKGSQK